MRAISNNVHIYLTIHIIKGNEFFWTRYNWQGVIIVVISWGLYKQDQFYKHVCASYRYLIDSCNQVGSSHNVFHISFLQVDAIFIMLVMRSYQWWLPSLDQKAVRWYPLSVAGIYWIFQCGYRPCQVAINWEIKFDLFWLYELWSFLHALFLIHLPRKNELLISYMKFSFIFWNLNFIKGNYGYRFSLYLEVLLIIWNNLHCMILNIFTTVMYRVKSIPGKRKSRNTQTYNKLTSIQKNKNAIKKIIQNMEIQRKV